MANYDKIPPLYDPVNVEPPDMTAEAADWSERYNADKQELWDLQQQIYDDDEETRKLQEEIKAAEEREKAQKRAMLVNAAGKMGNAIGSAFAASAWRKKWKERMKDAEEYSTTVNNSARIRYDAALAAQRFDPRSSVGNLAGYSAYDLYNQSFHGGDDQVDLTPGFISAMGQMPAFIGAAAYLGTQNRAQREEFANRQKEEEEKERKYLAEHPGLQYPDNSTNPYLTTYTPAEPDYTPRFHQGYNGYFSVHADPYQMNNNKTTYVPSPILTPYNGGKWINQNSNELTPPLAPQDSDEVLKEELESSFQTDSEKQTGKRYGYKEYNPQTGEWEYKEFNLDNIRFWGKHGGKLIPKKKKKK